ncbi:MAG: NAD(P)H-hydrate dehydratase [Deferrisomatales bacterium]|nr:NAD(P)H-hydrate dehydratase [Deferrisomatales bacterium]
MIPLLTAAEMRALDAHAVQEVGIPGVVLMETAGRAVFRELWSAFRPQALQGPVAVVCGRGNNGGDGFVVARCLCNLGCRVTVLLLGRREDVAGEAGGHLTAYLGSGGSLVEVTDGGREDAGALVRGAALAVDAVLGTGLSGEVSGLAADAVGWLNAARCPVVSVDIPSGVCSDTGRVWGAAVRADLTVTFAWPKRGHYLHPGAGLRARLVTAEIGIPPASLARVSPGLRCLEEPDFLGLLDRPRDAHKGSLGHVVVLGGSPGKSGAPGLAAWGALRAGAGLATVAAPAGCLEAGRLPLEVMTEPLGAGEKGGGGWEVDLWERAADALGRADALVVGPGMGTAPGAAGFLGRLLTTDGAPAVLDADALNLVAGEPGAWDERRRPVVLTPHPGEAARLLGVSSGEVQADRVGVLEALCARYGCPVILKGAGTLVGAPGEPVHLVPVGNPGMATAGTGDVLAGILGALLARGLETAVASGLAAYVHGLAGDLAAEAVGEEALVASDLLAALPRALNRLSGAGRALPCAGASPSPAGLRDH